jgi:hypothetical protein
MKWPWQKSKIERDGGWIGPLEWVMWLKDMKVPKEAEYITVNGDTFKRVHPPSKARRLWWKVTGPFRD